MGTQQIIHLAIINLLLSDHHLGQNVSLQDILNTKNNQDFMTSIDSVVVVDKYIPNIYQYLSQQSELDFALLVANLPISDAEATKNKSQTLPFISLGTISPFFFANDKFVKAKVKRKFYFNETLEQFFLDHKPIPLTYFTELEHKFLSYLYQKAERICSHHQIAEHVWNGVASKNTISKMVSRVRKKLNQFSPDAGNRYILTSRGYQQGYLFSLKA